MLIRAALGTTDVTIGQSWGVLLAQHQKQKLVASELTLARVQFFLPLIEYTSIINGRHIRKQRPLLGRYILFAINDLWERLARLRGVAGMMMDVDKLFPAKVCDSALDYIRSMCVNDVYCPRVVEGRKGFLYGQRVTPKEGPMAYHVGLYDGVRSRHREVALFNLFGREQRITFKAGDLVAA